LLVITVTHKYLLNLTKEEEDPFDASARDVTSGFLRRFSSATSLFSCSSENKSIGDLQRRSFDLGKTFFPQGELGDCSGGLITLHPVVEARPLSRADSTATFDLSVRWLFQLELTPCEKVRGFVGGDIAVWLK
jgi:hypothetical protein